MRMDADYYEELSATIAVYDTAEERARYRAGDFPRALLVEDLDKRYRWDLFYLAEWDLRVKRYVLLDPALNMDHIDTALRRIVKAL